MWSERAGNQEELARQSSLSWCDLYTLRSAGAVSRTWHRAVQHALGDCESLWWRRRRLRATMRSQAYRQNIVPDARVVADAVSMVSEQGRVLDICACRPIPLDLVAAAAVSSLQRLDVRYCRLNLQQTRLLFRSVSPSKLWSQCL